MSERAEKIKELSRPVFYPIPRDATEADYDRIAELIHRDQAAYDAALKAVPQPV